MEEETRLITSQIRKSFENYLQNKKPKGKTEDTSMECLFVVCTIWVEETSYGRLPKTRLIMLIEMW